MQELIQSYVTSIRETEQAISTRKKLYALATQKTDCRKYIEDSGLSIYKDMTLEELERDINILSASVSSMRHAVVHMRHEQSIHQHMNFKRLGNKEVMYDPEWLKQFKTDGPPMLDEEQLTMQQEKAQLVKRMVSVLNKKQMVILELKAAQYSHAEIAKVLGIPKGTVDVEVTRIRRKIEEEGWMMI